MTKELVLTARDVHVDFVTSRGVLRAVDGVDFDLYSGETHALVGESGCGKSTFARTLVRLQEITRGRVSVADKPIDARTDRRWLSRQLQIVFQDPDASLNPRMTILEAVGEPLRIHTDLSRSAIENEVAALLERVGMDRRYMQRFPHELSGGQKQRLSIARALAVEPRALICDEAVSALDVSIQAQILNLLSDLQDELGLAILFITHDLSVVRYLADRVTVMYLGQVVETAQTSDLFADPRHPYTQGLLSAVPEIDPTLRKKRVRLTGEIPSPLNPPSGCRFHTRCPRVFEPCPDETPALVSREGRITRCFLYTPD